MKIAYVAFSGERSANGGFNSLFELVSRTEPGSAVLVTQKESPPLPKWRLAGIDCQTELIDQGANRWSKLSSVLTSGASLKRYFRDHDFDAVVCNDIRAMLHAAPAARRLGIPVIFFVRDIFEPQRRYGFKWKLAAQMADLILGLSSEMATELKQRLKPLLPGSVDVDYVYSIVDFDRMTTVDPKRRSELRSAIGIEPNEFSIVYAAGFCDKKNQLELIRQLPSLFQRVPNAHVHFLGDFQPDQDPYSRKCQQLALQLGIERNLSFHGYAGHISDWYQLSDCTLLASRREGMARCMIESLSCGTPVVSFDVTSAREILEGHQCGFVAQQGDYDLLFDQLHQLSSNPEIRSQMGTGGSQVSRQLFSSEANLRKFQSLITTRLASETNV